MMLWSGHHTSEQIEIDVVVRVLYVGADWGVVLWFRYHTPKHVEGECHGMSTMVRSG